jgi:hypothetical protein
MNNAVRNSNYMALNDWMVLSNGMEGMCKETVMAYFKVLSQYLFGGTDKNHDKRQSG